MAKIKKGKAAKKKVVVDPQVQAQRKQKRTIRTLFERLGFTRFASDGVKFNFNGRTGEIDDLFLHENIMVLAEYTVGQPSSTHVTKKSILFGYIEANQEDWVEFACDTFPALSAAVEAAGYELSDYRVKVCYFSLQQVSDELEGAYPNIHFLDGTKTRYFDALARTIHKSARHELFKFLGLEFKEIGAEIKQSATSTRVFEGHVLPESFSSFPKDFKVVSFYADPSTLLTMSYVLRRDSWRDDEGMYQRVLQRGRMNQMRKYLTTEKRVFVNNIIVTLPDETKLNDQHDHGKNVNPKTITKVMNVNIAVPMKSNVIGLVDGQHRVFCYHEGVDKYEPKIKALRDRQNLLVTGIIYPAGYKEVEKRRFEAKLFLEINDKQKRTGSELKQSIELILSPYSTIAIAKAVVQRLNRAGALKGLLQTNYFDPPSLIKTTSIVSYGLRPLLKLDGPDSLFSVWSNKDKQRLRDLQKNPPASSSTDPLVDEYITYCTKCINDLLIAAKKVDDPANWKLTDKAKDRMLSPTLINGFIVCLRMLVENGKLSTLAVYETRLSGLSTQEFKSYRSSQWKALGGKIYSKYFAN